MLLAAITATAEPASVRTVASFTPFTPLPYALHLSALARDGQPLPPIPDDVAAAPSALTVVLTALQAPPAPVRARAAADTVVQAAAVPAAPSAAAGACGPFRHGDAVARWYTLVASYSDWDVCTGLHIIDLESGGDPNIWNSQGSGACGLWQTLPCDRGTDPVANTELAHLKWLARGWHPWSVYTGD